MAASWTEKTVLDMVEPRYRKPGNGGSGEYAFMRQVRNDAGFDASRTFDAVAVHLWPSRGFQVDVIEVKVSRSDWQRELKDPAKAEAAFQVANRFIVAAPAGIVHTGEVPPGWGLLEVTDKRCRMTVQPAMHHPGGVKKRTTFPAGLVISMLRSAGAASLKSVDQEAVDAQVATIRAELREEYDRQHEHYQALADARATNALAFLDGTGMYLHDEDDARQKAKRVKAALHADRGRASLVQALQFQHDRLGQMIRDLTPSEGDDQ